MTIPFADRLNNVETSAIRELFKLLGKPGIISFAGGFPDSAMFDVEGIREASQRVLTDQPGPALQYGATEGFEPLREAIVTLMKSRGANVANMQHFERDFAAPDAPVRTIKLEQNYRSHGNILDCANALIEHNTRRLGKNLWTDAGEGEPVRIHEAFSDALEAQWLVDEIRQLARDLAG